MTQAKKTIHIECFRCNGCGNSTFSTKKLCPKCQSSDIEIAQSQGKGVVVDFANVYYPPNNYKGMAPYTSVLVQLDNGCKLFGVIEGEVKDLPPGSPVTFIRHDENTGGLFFQLG